MPGQFEGTRGQAQSFIPGMVGEGLTNAQIVDNLKLAGLSYRTANMYADVNRIRLEQFAGEGLKGFDVDTPVPSNLMKEWQGETDFKYRVVVQYDYTDSNAGMQYNAGTTLYYDEPPTVSQVLEDWDIRVKTLEGGFGSTTDIQQIEGIKEINYFYNTPKG
jgi:hypothetical protein